MSPRTFEIYEVGLRRHVLPVLGSRQLRSITPDELVAWIRGMRAAGYAPHSVHNYWAPLHLVLGYAVRHGIIPASPADRLTSAERPKPGSGRRRFLSKPQMEQLLSAAPDRYRVAIACALFSGVRLSELLGLIWADVNFGEQAEANAKGPSIRVVGSSAPQATEFPQPFIENLRRSRATESLAPNGQRRAASRRAKISPSRRALDVYKTRRSGQSRGCPLSKRRRALSIRCGFRL